MPSHMAMYCVTDGILQYNIHGNRPSGGGQAIDGMAFCAYAPVMTLGPILPPPDAGNAWHDAFVRRLLGAFTRISGRDLGAELGMGPAPPGRFFHDGDFALLSHRGDEDATLNYGNGRALALWECDWAQFTAMASRLTAPREGRGARAAMMDQVVTKGFVAGYSGERISRTGRRFLIQDGIVWRLRDADGTPFGVAAFVPRVTPL